MSAVKADAKYIVLNSSSRETVPQRLEDPENGVMGPEMHSEGGGETFLRERAETGASERERGGRSKATHQVVKVVEERLALAQLLTLESLLRHPNDRKETLGMEWKERIDNEFHASAV